MSGQVTISLQEYEGLQKTIERQQQTIDSITPGKKPVYLSDRPLFYTRYLSVDESEVVASLQEVIRKKEKIIEFLKSYKPSMVNFSRQTVGESLHFELSQQFQDY